MDKGPTNSPTLVQNFQKILASFITSSKISRRTFEARRKELEINSDLVFQEDKNVTIPVYAKKSISQKCENSLILRTFLFHLSNSIQKSFYGDGYVEVANVDLNAELSHTVLQDVAESTKSTINKPLEISGRLTNVILYTEDFLTVFIFFNSDDVISTDVTLFSHIQHERHLFVKCDPHEQDIITSKRESTEAKTYSIMELTLELIRERIVERRLIPERYLNENYRGRTYTCLALGVDNSNLDIFNPYIPMIVEGYTNFFVKNPDKYVENKDLSQTADTKMFLTDKIFFTIKREPKMAEKEKIRDQVEDFTSFGALAGLIETYLNLFQHEHFEVLNQIRSRSIWYHEIFSRLNSILSLSSKISDPNFIETPLLKKMVRYLIEAYNYDDFYKSLRDTMNILVAARTQRLIVYLTAAVIATGVLSAILTIITKL